MRRSATPLTFLLPLAGLLSAGCEVGLPGDTGGFPSGGTDGGVDLSRGGPVDLAGGGAATGVPCDVQAILTAHCFSCHGAVPSGGASMSLSTYAELTAPSYADPTMSFAQRSVARMMSNVTPMPPAPASAVPAADIATIAAWVNAGAPRGTCGGTGDGGVTADPLNAAATCTSGSTSRSNEGTSMNPGEACISCHTQRGQRAFTIAGTLFATGHEPNRCNGATGAAADVGQAQIVIVDANHRTTTIAVSSPSGNFTYSGAIATPYTAKVVYQGRERVMATPQTSGDCNGCHTATGSSTTGGAPAPGRVTMPL